MATESSSNTVTVVVIVTAVALVVGGIIAAMSASGAFAPTTTPSPKSTAVSTIPDAISPSKVALVTSMGTINLDLFVKDAPRTVANFATLGKRGYYNKLIFHRVINDFMIQGGDPKGTGSGGESIYGAKFEDEINPNKLVRGVLAMANAGPNTNGSQFFIVTKDATDWLDGKHTAFGKVADEDSLKVLMSIQDVSVDGNDKPLTPVTIEEFKVLDEATPAAN